MKLLLRVLVWTGLTLAGIAALAQTVVPSNLQYNWPAVTTTGQLGNYIVFNGLNAPRPSNFRVDWTLSGTAPDACTFNVQGSADNVTWTNLDGAPAVACTASGTETVTLSPVLMLRVNLASYTGAGNGTTVVKFHYTGSGVSSAGFGSQTANTFYAGPNGAPGNPTFRAMVAADVPTLNQSTTGTAVGLSGSQTANFIYAAPNGSSGTAGFRAMAAADLPAALTPTTVKATTFYTAAEACANGGSWPSCTACTTAATIDPANGNKQRIVLTNAQTCALTFTQPVGKTVNIQVAVIQSSAGSFDGLISGCTWPGGPGGGVAPVITALSGAVDSFTVTLDTATARCQIAQAFK